MTDQQSGEQEIFLAAIEKADRLERSEYLDAVCAADTALRRRVEQLLAAHDQSLGPFDIPPDAVSNSGKGPPTVSVGNQIGQYKLLQEIGEGGMGVVYMAEQAQPISRRVALKLIKPGMDSRQVIARFEAERQALALMDHPSIARVLDAGSTESGQPYFVMELVHGVPITKYCDEQRLTMRQRFELFLPVCHAVQHAHQKGIIHRDLKPSNILVTCYDGRPLPKIIDFGVAKATQVRLTQKTLFTDFGHIVGTLEYMSPEQARLDHWDVDTRSDVYSLGVLLYELLVGETPFDRQRIRSVALDEVLRMIREEDPPTPSKRASQSSALPAIAENRRLEPRKLGSLLRGDPDWIVMKALDKDRTRRYESAESLAADITRLLNSEPVSACPPTRAYRLTRFLRRNKLLVLALGMVGASLFVGMVVASWQAVIARRERDEAEQAMRREANQRRLAVRAREQLSEALQQTQLSRRMAEQTVIDLYESQGVVHSDHAELADAALWFSHAAVLCDPVDANRRDANLLRVQAFSRGGPRPVRAFYRTVELPQLHFDPTGSYLACHTADLGGERRYPIPSVHVVWDVKQQREFPLPFEAPDITSMTWSPSGKQIAIASAQHGLLLAEFPSLEYSKLITGTLGERGLAYSPDANYLACGHGQEVWIWNVKEAKWLEPRLEHPAEVRYIGWSPDSTRLVSVCGFEARVFPVPCPTGQPLFPAVRHVTGHWITHRSAVWPLFVDQGSLLVTIDSHVRWRDALTGEQRGNREIRNEMNSIEGREEPVKEGVAAMTPGWNDKSVKIAVFAPTRAPILDIQLSNSDGQTPGEMQFFHATRGLTSLCHSMDGGVFLASGSEHGIVTVETNADSRLLQHNTAVTSITFSPNNLLLATAQHDGLIRVWDLRSGVADVRPLPVTHSSLATMSRDGKYVAPIGAAHNQVRPQSCTVYATDDGQPAAERPITPGGQIVDGRFSADCRLLAIACRDPNLITFWNWRDGTEIFSRFQLSADPRGIEFGPNDLLAVLCSDATLLLVDGTNGRVTTQWKTSPLGYNGEPVNNGRVKFSPDGRTLVSYGFVAEVWDVATGRLRYPGIRHGFRCHDIAFSPDGRLLATAGYDGFARVWDLATGQTAGPDLHHPAWVFSVRFSSDGNQLLTGCSDRMARLWDWRAGRLAHAPLKHEGQVFLGEFMPDDRSILTASDDSRWCLWERQTGRPLTPRILYEDIGIHRSVCIMPDGKRLVFSGLPLSLVDLSSLPSDLLTPRESRRRAELHAGRTIESGGEVNLTTKEWVDRWQKWEKLPDLPIVELSTSESL